MSSGRWLPVCLSVSPAVRLSVPLLLIFAEKSRPPPSSPSSSAAATAAAAAAFSRPTATVASRGALFGLFEWSSRSLCREAGLAGWTVRGRRSRLSRFFPRDSLSQNSYFTILKDVFDIVICIDMYKRHLHNSCVLRQRLYQSTWLVE